MTEDQRKAALDALDRIENDALSCRDGYGETTKDAETIRSALQSPQVPAIEGLEEAIQYLIRVRDLYSREEEKWRMEEEYSICEMYKTQSDWISTCIKVAEEYSKLQNGE